MPENYRTMFNRMHPPLSGRAYAVVTGASQGLGKAFALELAARKIPLILLSLKDQGLSELCLELRQRFGVEAIPFECDLSDPESVLLIASSIGSRYPVQLLINNAGMGGTARMTEADPRQINRMLQVNVTATALLTRTLLPSLLQQPRSWILNVFSMAGLSPIGYKTVYPASKAFVHSLSRGLCEELRNTTVFVSVVNPGAMRTNAEISSRIERQGWLGRLTLLEPEQVARTCIRRLFRRDSVIVVNPWSWLMLQVLPIWIRLPLLTRAVKRELAV